MGLSKENLGLIKFSVLIINNKNKIINEKKGYSNFWLGIPFKKGLIK